MREDHSRTILIGFCRLLCCCQKKRSWIIARARETHNNKTDKLLRPRAGAIICAQWTRLRRAFLRVETTQKRLAWSTIGFQEKRRFSKFCLCGACRRSIAVDGGGHNRDDLAVAFACAISAQGFWAIVWKSCACLSDPGIGLSSCVWFSIWWCQIFCVEEFVWCWNSLSKLYFLGVGITC